MPRILTLQQLRDAGACAGQVEQFRCRFGEQVAITPKVCCSVADVFDFKWAGNHLLSQVAQVKYERIRDAAWVDYERIRDAAWAEYRRALDTHEPNLLGAAAEYERIVKAVWAEYQRATIAGFADAYNTDVDVKIT